jgi:hypothetical protein
MTILLGAVRRWRVNELYDQIILQYTVCFFFIIMSLNNPRSSNITDDDDDENNTTGRVTIRKRAAADRSNLHSSMVTVIHEDLAATNAAAANLADNDHLDESEKNNISRSGSRGSFPDDYSFRSGVTDANSLICKMQTALNGEEWWTKRQQEIREHKAAGPPVKTVSEEDSRSPPSQQKKLTKKRTRRADCVFGVLLLAVGFVVGGVFIHRDKIMMEMNSLLGGGSSSSSSHSSPSLSSSRAEQRQLPLSPNGMPMTYEERQQFYRQQKMHGNLRQSQHTGQLVIDWKKQQEYQQYHGGDNNQFQGERH